jgi:hypothetical protein
MSDAIYDQLGCDDAMKSKLREFEEIKKMPINEIFNQVLIFRTGLYGHPIYIKIVQYMMDDPEAANIFTPDEIKHYKEEMQSELNYHIEHNIDKCFELNIKSHYNMVELGIITKHIFSNVPVYLGVINLLYRSLQNYYGRGKVQLNPQNPEDFINNVMTLLATYNYNPAVIRNQIKTVKVMELMIKKMNTVVLNHMLPAVGSKYQSVIKSHKDLVFKCIEKKVETFDFGTNDLAQLKTLYNSRNKLSYKTLMDIVNTIILNNISLHSLFHNLYQQKPSILDYTMYRLISEFKKNELEIFTDEKKEVLNSLVNFESMIMDVNALSLAYELYQTNVKLRKIINCKEQQQKDAMNLD